MGVTVPKGCPAIFNFLQKAGRNTADSLAWLFNDLAEYPGLHFLKRPAEALEHYIERFDAAMEQKDRMKQQLETTKSRAAEMGEIGHRHGHGHDQGDEHGGQPGKKGGKPGQRPAPDEEHGTLRPGMQPGDTVRGKPAKGPPAEQAHGTLMLDAFMQSASIPPEVREQWLKASGAHAGQGATSGDASHSGTLMSGTARTVAPGATIGPQRAVEHEPITARVETPAAFAPPSEPLLIPTGGFTEAPREEPAPAPRWSEPARYEPRQEPPRQEPARFEPASRESAGDYADYAPPPTRQSTPMREPMQAPANPQYEEREADWTTVTTVAATIEEDQPAIIPLGERKQQLARLEFVCQKLRELRQPLCPANGALAVLPMPTVLAGPREMVELQKAIRADLATVQGQLKQRFPVAALATGMEDDPGFEELVRRVGPERARSQRFGHRFDVRSVPTPEQLSALSVRISGVFEDWVYAIYRERGAIARRGNSDLFGMLCKVRTQLQERLMRVLCGGFGHDPDRTSRDEPIAFSGCYFAATGRSEDRRAFVSGVFDKLNEEQDNVEWTRDARRDDRRFRRAGWFALALAAASLIGVALNVLLRRL